jgi:hypothetical protein
VRSSVEQIYIPLGVGARFTPEHSVKYATLATEFCKFRLGITSGSV